MKNYVTLGDVCSKGSSNIAQKDIENNNGSYGIYGASGFIKNVDFYHRDEPYIAIVKDGAGIGRAMLLPAKTSVIGTMQYIIPNDLVCVKYLYYAIVHMNLSKYFSGATIPHIYFRDYQYEKLPLPAMEEQQKITKKLHNIDKLIELCKAICDKFDVLVKSRFVEMFGNFIYDQKRWFICTVGDVAETIDPQPSHRTPPISSDGIPYIGIAECDYKTQSINFSAARKVGKNVLEEHINRYDLSVGDFIIGKIGTIGKPFFVPIERNYTLSANTVLIQPNVQKVSPQYLFSIFQSEYMDRIIDSEKKSTSQPAFGIQKVRSIKIPLPPLALQEQFAAFVEQTDKSKFMRGNTIYEFAIEINKKYTCIAYRYNALHKK